MSEQNLSNMSINCNEDNHLSLNNSFDKHNINRQ